MSAAALQLISIYNVIRCSVCHGHTTLLHTSSVQAFELLDSYKGNRPCESTACVRLKQQR